MASCCLVTELAVSLPLTERAIADRPDLRPHNGGWQRGVDPWMKHPKLITFPMPSVVPAGIKSMTTDTATVYTTYSSLAMVTLGHILTSCSNILKTWPPVKYNWLHCYSAQVVVQSIVINQSVCASVCPRAYFWNRWTDPHKILCTYPLWP